MSYHWCWVFVFPPLLFPAVAFFFLMKCHGHGASPPPRVLPEAQGGSKEFGAAREGHLELALTEEMAALCNGDNTNQNVTIPPLLSRGTISSSSGSWMSWSVSTAHLSRCILSWQALCSSQTFGGCIMRGWYRRRWKQSLFPVQTAQMQGSSKFLARGYRDVACWVEGCPHTDLRLSHEGGCKEFTAILALTLGWGSRHSSLPHHEGT